MDKRFIKLDFWLSVLILIWFFIPGEMLGWAIDPYGEPQSGLQLMLDFGRGGLVLLLVPLAAVYIIVCNFYGENAFLPYAKRGILLGITVFMLLTILNTMRFGFFLTLAIGIYLWWASMRKKS